MKASWKKTFLSLATCLFGSLICYYLGSNPIAFLIGFFLFAGGLLLLGVDE